ncbi:MAG: right-handed parallel beta-helix repeat-containing protein [Mangrovicoccus sp.]|nr:right-handed parallel beta-helix repeat-containing protein [Mangrovicoccus sp.]
MAEHLVSSSSELKTLLEGPNIQGGDTIKLASGAYSGFHLKNISFETPVTITSNSQTDRAVFNGTIDIRSCEGLSFSGFDAIEDNLPSGFNKPLIHVQDSDGITFSDVTVEGYLPTAEDDTAVDAEGAARNQPIIGLGYSLGIRVQNSDNVTIEDCSLSDLRKGVSTVGGHGLVEGLVITGCEFYGLREGINIPRTTNTLIENNYFHDFKVHYATDHGDMIQYFGSATDTNDPGVHGLTITGNLFHQAPTPGASNTQTIYGGMHGRPASDFTITDNLIINGHKNAVVISSVDGFEVSNNLLLSNDTSETENLHLPTIRIDNNASNGTITDNVHIGGVGDANKIYGLELSKPASNNIQIQNNLLLSKQASDADWWGNVLNAIIDTPSDHVETPGNPVDYLDLVNGIIGGDTGGNGGDPNTDPNAPAAMDRAQLDPSTTTLTVQTGTASNDDISSSASVDNLINAQDGDDKLLLRGSDGAIGGNGADTFVLDARNSLDGTYHAAILDLDFAQGDLLELMTEVGNYFTDSADPNNALRILSGGTRARIDSLEDLAELVAAGSITAADSDAGDSVVIALNANDDLTLELVGITTDMFL